ncbi:MAG: hypothetical protein M3548_17950 [Actinomycetota bacterium]|nr:hypothetical protein [Actinomycetota bacterium]
MSKPKDNMPDSDAVASMLQRMAKTAADSEAQAGKHGSSAEYDQLSAAYRDARKPN